MSDPWRDGAPELSGRLLRPMMQLYTQRFGTAALDTLLGELGTTRGLLEDPDRWYSAERFIALNHAMVERSGDRKMPYRAGRDLWEPATLGPARLGLFDLVTTRQALEALPRVSPKVSRISSWEVEITGNGRGRATFRPHEGALDDWTFCDNRLGTLESIPRVIGLLGCHVEHPVCLHRGGSACVYDLHWRDPPPWTRMFWLGGAGSALVSLAGLLEGAAWAPTSAGLAAGLLIVAGLRGSETAAQRRQTAWDTEQLVELNERRVRELTATQRVSDAIRGFLDPTTLIEKVLEELRESLNYDRALYFSAVDDHLVLTGAVGLDDADMVRANVRISLSPDGDDDRLFGNIVRLGQARLVDDIETYSGRLLPENRRRLEAIGTRGFIAAPVSWRGDRHGLLLVDYGEQGRTLDVRDQDILASIAGSLAAGLSSADLYDEAREALLINQKFRQYLPKSVVDEVQADPEAALQLGGSTLNAAIVFCDIAGFTEMSSKSSPEEVISALNVWFGMTDPIIEAHRGIIDKRIGDAILMVFLHEEGDRPEDHPVRRAVAASEAMQTSLREPHEIGTFATAFDAMRVRHAIHYGEVIAGNLGSLDRMEYTILGDAVNVCARLEERTPAGAVWLTGEALQAIGGEEAQRYQRTETLTLRGRMSATSAYQVETLEDDLDG